MKTYSPTRWELQQAEKLLKLAKLFPHETRYVEYPEGCGGDPFSPMREIYCYGPHVNCDAWDLEHLPKKKPAAGYYLEIPYLEPVDWARFSTRRPFESSFTVRRYQLKFQQAPQLFEEQCLRGRFYYERVQ